MLILRSILLQIILTLNRLIYLLKNLRDSEDTLLLIIKEIYGLKSDLNYEQDVNSETSIWMKNYLKKKIIICLILCTWHLNIIYKIYYRLKNNISVKLYIKCKGLVINSKKKI